MARIWILVLASVLAACTTLPDEIVLPAAALNSEIPAYPLMSRRLAEQGSVILRVYVQADGSAGEIQIQKSSGSRRLDSAAVEAAKNSKFRPAQARSGRDVGSWVDIPYTFVLKK